MSTESRTRHNKRLRSRISLAFLLIFIFSQLCVMGLFYLIESERQKKSGHRIVKTFKVLLHEVVRYYLPSSAYLKNRAKIEQLRKMLIRFKQANAFAKIWLTDDKGDVIVQSFPGPIPSFPMKIVLQHDKVVIRQGANQGGYRYTLVEMPFFLSDGVAVYLKIYARAMFKLQPKDIVFLLGILGLTLAIGPITFFVSRIITRPLKELIQTAQLVSGGDLSIRAKSGASDEIGELSFVLNSMLDFIERLLRGTKELTANISHELRTPLTRILISRELLEDHLDNYKKGLFTKHLGYIQKDVERMDMMISRILLLSRLDIQPGDSAVTLVDFSALLYDLVGSFEGALQSGHFQLNLEVVPDLKLYAQEEELITAFSNLFDNAIKYSPEGSCIEVYAKIEDSAVIVCVKNRLLASIKKEPYTERLLEPFYRPKEVHSNGSGLGLAITRKIVENIEGNMSVAYEGEYFVVKLILPIAEKDVEL